MHADCPRISRFISLCFCTILLTDPGNIFYKCTQANIFYKCTQTTASSGDIIKIVFLGTYYINVPRQTHILGTLYTTCTQTNPYTGYNHTGRMKLLQYVTLPNVSPSPCKLYTNINQHTNEIQSHFIECHMGSHYIHVTCSIIRLTHLVAHFLQF